MAPFNNQPALMRLLAQRFPAVDTAGFHYEPITGLSSESWRIRFGENVWLARPQTPEGTTLGTCRQREYRLLRQMSEHRLAPAPLLCRDGWLIVAWQKGVILSRETFAQCLDDGRVARLLCRLHRLPRAGYHLALSAQLARHWQHMDARRRTPALLRLHRYFQHAPQPAMLAYAPLHLDVHAENVLMTPAQHLMLIDWEYAADGDIALELAFLMRSNALDDAQQQRLLETYQQQRPGLALAALTRSVRQWLPWVDYLILMWFEVRWHQTGQTCFLSGATLSRCRLGLAS